ncbi:MAG TPA: hypothetical protein VJ673_13915 [Aromatoleum sp.]|uniref:hypothetical protein n=1 Tax=Aromatoleum sp. TaxID=2307007 RepID=UPI002B485A12|nr:hypothetical protein [Aromatoleum sp.]HJV26779.1 hypothetical protein [Aromatoleum sp.]
MARVARILPLAACLLTVPVSTVAADAVTRRETSLSLRACQPPARALVRDYQRRGLGVVRCPAPRGFSLLFVSSDANSWLDLRRGASTWSAQHAVVNRRGAGNSPNVTGLVLWLRDVQGWRGLVFTVGSRDESDERRLAYFAVRTDPSRICLLGTFDGRSEAEAAVMSRRPCVQERGAAG